MHEGEADGVDAGEREDDYDGHADGYRAWQLAVELARAGHTGVRAWFAGPRAGSSQAEDRQGGACLSDQAASSMLRITRLPSAAKAASN